MDLPLTRQSLTRKFKVADHKIYITVGFYPDESPGEVFITAAKEGSFLGGLLDSLAITISIALQNGVEWEELASKYRDCIFEPSDDKYKSLVDAIGRNVTELIEERASIRGEPCATSTS